MTRRVLLGTGAFVAGAAAFVGGAQLTGRLDDVADALGVDPRPEPDPRDTRLVRRAATVSAGLLAALEVTAARHPALALAPLIAVAREQVAAVGGAPSDGLPPPAAADEPDDAVRGLEALYTAASRARASDSDRAASPDLARVLASMAAGLSQGAVAVRGLR